MNFEDLLKELGENWAGVRLFSVENREMMSHETDCLYFFHLTEAVLEARRQWELLPNQEERDYHEICVHEGELEESANRLRFVVLQKHFKAYKKVYVSQEFADRFRKQFTEKMMAEQGMTLEDATAEAKKMFNASYTIQPIVRFGMFAGYNYAPDEYDNLS